MDLVGTCPKNLWKKWIEEGDAAGDNYTGTEWAWFTKSRVTLKLQKGDRFYVVCNGKLRGYALVTRVFCPLVEGGPVFAICRRGGAVAVTIPETIPGFRGLRKRWWEREQEVPFPDWKEA